MVSELTQENPRPDVERVLRVLLADDQADVLAALQLLLKGEGIQTQSVDSPAAIVEAVQSSPFDLILMDLNYTRDTTSGEEGLDLLNQLASLDNAPPVLVMTAWGSIELAVEAMRRGARDFVMKPWDNHQLVQMLRRHARSVAATAPATGQASRDRYSGDELTVAAQVQRKLWPAGGRELPGLELAGHCLPAGAVGGDTFDFIELGRERIAFVLADVSGKGMPAALMMANLQAILRARATQAEEALTDFLDAANRRFFESTQAQHYATLFFAEFDGDSRRLRYVNGGHPPAILWRSDGRLERLFPTARPLGLFAELDCSAVELSLEPGDTLVTFSDGVVEATRADGDELGEWNLVELVRKRTEVGLPLQDWPEALIREIVSRFSYKQTDDMTVVVARGR